MQYIELLRARRALTWYGGIVVLLLALCLALVFKDGRPHFNAGRDPQLPFDAILAGTSFGMLILAAFMAVCFDAEFKTAAIAWTRPMSRLQIALRYLAVDGGTLLAAWLITLVCAMIAIATVGATRFLTYDGHLWTFVALSCGVAVMWYGLVVLGTMLLPGRGGAIAGGSWGYALIVPGLSKIPFPPLLHQVMVGLNYLNPLAYFSGPGDSSHVDAGTVIIGSMAQHAFATWAIGLAAIALGVWMWTRREVPT